MKIPYKLFLILFIYLIPQFLIGKTLINDDLKNSLESLYNNNPKLKYHINILKCDSYSCHNDGSRLHAEKRQKPNSLLCRKPW